MNALINLECIQYASKKYVSIAAVTREREREREREITDYSIYCSSTVMDDVS